MRILLFLLVFTAPTLPSYSQTELQFKKKLSLEIKHPDAHQYSINSVKGDFYKVVVMQHGIDLVIELPRNGSENISFDSPNGMEGPEPMEFIAEQTGTTVFTVKPFVDSTNMLASTYTIEYIEHIDAAEYNRLQKLKADKEKAFLDWIRIESKPIKSVTAGSGFEDLAPLKKILNGKKVVALGEATHGTKEFFQMKHRMLEFLVKEMGFTVFAIEASLSRCRYVNDYILYGKGDLDTATVIQGFTTWRTEEVKEMIRWMREYNKSNPATKIQFVGYDLQVNDAAAYDISNYYKKVDPSKKQAVDSLLKKIVAAEQRGGIFSGDTSIRLLRKPLEDLISGFEQNKEKYRRATTKEEYDETLWLIQVLCQYIISYSYDNFAAIMKKEDRDFYMAQNIISWLRYFPPGTKMMVWAHNGHVAKNYLDALVVPSMGSHLKKELKDEYYSIGFDFYKGKFQSNDIDLPGSPGWEEHEIGAAPKGNLSAFFVQAGLGNSFLDLTSANKNIRDWLNENRVGTYSMGSQFSKKWTSASYIASMKLMNAFDGVIFIKESTRAVPVKNLIVNRYSF